MHNLYEILKKTIYILIIEELKLPKSRFYDDFKKEARKFFALYKVNNENNGDGQPK